MALTKVSRGLLSTGIVDNSNATAITIDSSENVGIGTSSPNSYTGQTTLNINSAGVARLDLDIGDTMQGFLLAESGYTGLFTPSGSNSLRFGTNNTTRMTIDSSGRVGIGTSSFVNANAKLVVSNGTVDIEHYTDTAIGYVGTRSNHPFGLLTNGTPKLYITTAGNVGINQSSPAFALCISDDSNPNRNGMEIAIGTSDTSGNTIQNYNRATSAYTPLNIAGSTLTFGVGTNATERMRIASNGLVSIGTLSTTGATAGFAFSPYANNVGFGTQSSTTLSGFSYQYRFYNTNGQVGYISTDGSATAYVTSSDYRLKEDDVPMTGATERVKALRPVNFAWKADGSRVDGFFAHELAEVVPEATTGTKDAMMDEEYEVTAAIEEVRDEDDNITTEAVEAVMGTRSVPDMQGIDQSKLVPLLTASIQELIARIEALENGE